MVLRLRSNLRLNLFQLVYTGELILKASLIIEHQHLFVHVQVLASLAFGRSHTLLVSTKLVLEFMDLLAVPSGDILGLLGRELPRHASGHQPRDAFLHSHLVEVLKVILKDFALLVKFL